MDFHKFDYCLSSTFPAILFFMLNGNHRGLANTDAGKCAREHFVFRSFNETKLK